MRRKRWAGIISLTLITILAALGASLRPTFSASPPLQLTPIVTATFAPGTETASPIPMTATSIITATAIVTPTATAIVTQTETPIVTPSATAIVTPTDTPIPTTVPTMTATPTPFPGPPTRRPYWSFAAKFVCGEQLADVPGQETSGEPPVKPGNYATEINIHNPHYRGPIQIRTKVVLLVEGTRAARAPTTAAPSVFSPLFALRDDAGTMQDCNGIWEQLNPGVPPPSPMPLMIGYFVIVSPANLDVVSVLTATTSTSNLEPAGIALETLVVEGKRVVIPSTAFPDSALPREQEFTDE
jgi:hypothetical protein